MSRIGEQRTAAGYIRISALMGREQDNDLLSDKIQREKIESWAVYRGYRIVHWYIDLDVSGRKGTKRPEFERMMDDARAGRFETIAVYRLTRFARSIAVAANAIDELERLKPPVTLVSVTEDIDTGTIAGNLLRNILFALAEFESERISEEWKNVHENRRRRGIAHVAAPTLGYKVANAEIVGVDKAEAVAVRTMFNLRSAGAGYGSIRDSLEREGFASKTGRSRIPIPSIRYVLSNPLYAGLVRTSDGELLDGQHEAIVPRELWDRVQAIGRRTNAVAHHRASLLSGLIVCAGCGYRMNHDRDKSGPLYRCSSRGRAESCDRQATIRSAWADDHVENAFLRRFDPTRMPNSGRLRRTRQQAEWQKRAAKLRARVDELGRALDQLADQRWVKGSLSADEYERQATRYLAEKADVERQAEELETLVATVRPIEVEVLRLWPRLPLEVKQRALRIAIENVTVKQSPRRGPGQRALVPDRLDIAWLS